MEDMPREMSPWDGLEGAPVYRYKSIRSLQECVRSHASALMDGLTNKQYVVFMGVKKADLEKIDKQRRKIGLDTRFSHDTDANLLIVKVMPSKGHELGHLILAQMFKDELTRMGLPRNCVVPVGATRYERPESSKEGDSGYYPRQPRQQEDDWPTIVFESGYSESLARLRHDAQWWITKSQGDVKIVIIISVRPAEKLLVIEKWCHAPPPPNRRGTRSVQELTLVQNSTPQQGPTATSIATGQQISTVQQGTRWYDVCGGPLTLEFDKVFLRNPVPPESDIVFNATDLAEFAEEIWHNVR